MSKKNMQLLKKANEVYAEANGPGPAIIYDGDSILKKYGLSIEPGMFKEISDIYTKSRCRKSVEDLFEVLTGHSFEEYLNECIGTTYRQDAPSKNAT